MVALKESGEVIAAKTFGYGLKRTSSIEKRINRLIDIADEVMGFIKEAQAASSDVTVVIEGYAYGARGSQNDLAELQGTIKTQAYLMLDVVPVIMPVTKARKLVLGRGRVTKDQVIEELRVIGYTFTDHNQADAFVVARAAILDLADSVAVST